jgi:hypothetical protein
MLPVVMANRMNDETTLSFIRMAQPYFRGDSQNYLFNGGDIAPLVTKSLPSSLQYLLQASAVDWLDVSNVDRFGLTPLHHAMLQPDKEQLLIHLNNWTVQNGHKTEHVVDRWSRSIHHEAWQHSWDPLPPAILNKVEVEPGGWARGEHGRTPICEVTMVDGLLAGAEFYELVRVTLTTNAAVTCVRVCSVPAGGSKVACWCSSYQLVDRC